MKQTLILALLSFMVAVGGSTWFVTKVMPPRDAPAVALGRDTGSAKASTAPKKRSKPATEERRTTAPDSTAADTSGGKGPAKAGDPKPAARPADQAAGETEAATRAKSVAKILAQMKPKEAVAIMAKLTDDEVDRILRQLNAKQVAALLAVLPGERAASMSRRLLEPKTGREGGN